jgi:hypothetical protein
VSVDTHDVRPEQYAMVIREMIRHENDVTNHRVMWLLIGQGFIANAYVSARKEGALNDSILLLAGILLAVSAFLMLYKSYQARGYLEYLGRRAKQGTLPEADLPLTGWPGRRVEDWWRGVWASAWLGKTADLLEPWMFLPWLFVFTWMSVLLKQLTALGTAMAVGLGAIASAAVFAALSFMLVGLQRPEPSLPHHLDERGPP